LSSFIESFSEFCLKDTPQKLATDDFPGQKIHFDNGHIEQLQISVKGVLRSLGKNHIPFCSRLLSYQPFVGNNFRPFLWSGKICFDEMGCLAILKGNSESFRGTDGKHSFSSGRLKNLTSIRLCKFCAKGKKS